MIDPQPVTLEGHGVRLEPLSADHRNGLAAAATDGELWKLWYTSVPEPERVDAYIAAAQTGRDAGHMLPWAVRDLTTGLAVEPEPEERVAELVRFVREVVREMGEHRATGFLRKFYGWYLRGAAFGKAARLRAERDFSIETTARCCERMISDLLMR